MRDLLLIAIAVSACSAAAAQTPRVEDLCGQPQAAALLKRAVHQQMLVGDHAAVVQEATFVAGTTLESPLTIAVDRPLRKAECRGTLTVDASGGLEQRTDQALQMSFATNPGGLLQLQRAFSGPPDKRRYSVPMRYEVQLEGGKMHVSAHTIDELQALVTGGLLVGLQVSQAK